MRLCPTLAGIRERLRLIGVCTGSWQRSSATARNQCHVWERVLQVLLAVALPINRYNNVYD
jgi:hypothetical protein